MRVEEYDGAIERQVVTAFITSSEVLAHWANRWESGLCETPPANVVTRLCIKYYQKYGEPPGKDIVSLFTNWAASHPNHHATELASSYLAGLSSDYENAETNNGAFLCDLVGRHFTRVKTKKLIEDLKGCLASDELEEIPSKIEKFHARTVTEEQGVDLLTDRAYGQEVFDPVRRESLIDYPDALGVFFGRSLHRGAFVNFLAGEKVGKSWFLLDLAWRAMLQRRKVVFYSTGDMTIPEMLERFYVRAACRPLKAGTVHYPLNIGPKDKLGQRKVSREKRKFTDDMDFEIACQAFEDVAKYHLRSSKSYFRLYFHPNSTCTVDMISAELTQLQRRGFAADVVVVDYADILAPPPGVREPREQINENWKAMRKLSQQHRVLLVTATQAPARSYGAARLTKSHFAEDKRKRSHVTGEVGINQTDEDEEQGLYRLGWTVRRTERRKAMRQVYVASCLDVGNPAVLSAF